MLSIGANVRYPVMSSDGNSTVWTPLHHHPHKLKNISWISYGYIESVFVKPIRRGPFRFCYIDTSL